MGFSGSEALVAFWSAIDGEPFGQAWFGDQGGDTIGRGRARRVGATRALQESGTIEPAASLGVIGGIPVPELLYQLQQGHREALATLYTELFNSLWSLAVAYTHSPDTAKDLVHDVFLRVWMRRDTIKVDTDIRVYLAVAVRNHARNAGKHGRVIDAVERAASSGAVVTPAIGQPASASDAAAEEHEFHVAYQRVLGTLTERERTAVFLRWEEGMTLHQIAKVLSLSIEGVRGVIGRAQRKVQAALENYRT